MSIPELYKATKADPSVQKALSYLHKNTTPITYTTTAPTVDKVPFGGVVVHDDGINRRVYFHTGQGAIGYIPITVIGTV